MGTWRLGVYPGFGHEQLSDSRGKTIGREPDAGRRGDSCSRHVLEFRILGV